MGNALLTQTTLTNLSFRAIRSRVSDENVLRNLLLRVVKQQIPTRGLAIAPPGSE